MGARHTRVLSALVRLGVGLVMTFFATYLALTSSTGSVSAASTAPSPASVSFLSTGEGWVLALYDCPTGRCARVAKTLNAGATWRSFSLPLALQHLVGQNINSPFVGLNIYFANSEDGWIYGYQQVSTSAGPYVPPNAELWSTHDGGATWSSLHTPSLGMKYGIFSLNSSRGRVYAIAWLSNGTFGLWSSPVTQDSWHRVATPVLSSAAGGSSMDGAVVFQGTRGWLMVGNDRGVTGSARLTSTGRWVAWKSPCGNVGGSDVVPVLTSASTLVDICTIGGFGSYVAPGTPPYLKLNSNWFFTSHDEGMNFTPTKLVTLKKSSEWLELAPGLPASPTPGAILVGVGDFVAPKTSEHLYLTRNGGRTWSSVYTTPASSINGSIQFATFASNLGSAIVQTGTNTSILIVSIDGATTWHRTYL